jgi:photosystem II stability/assembly factor-like uncharacterized protein
MKSRLQRHRLLLSLCLSLSLFVFTSCKDEYIGPDSPNSCDAILEGWEITADSFPSMQLQRDIYFLDENVGYAVGNAATITKTIDGGRSWQRLHFRYLNGYNDDAITDVIFNTVWFVNESVGYVGGERESDFHHQEYSDAVLLKTTDGGLTWTKIYVPETKEIYDLTFFDELTGIGIFKLTNPGSNYAFQIRRTIDGGITWSGDVLLLSRLYHFKFYHSPSKVMCINDDGSEHPILWSTTDKGLTWQSVTLPETHYADLYIIDDQDIIGSFAHQGFERSLYKSADGGFTWEEFETPFVAKEMMHFLESAGRFCSQWHL